MKNVFLAAVFFVCLFYPTIFLLAADSESKCNLNIINVPGHSYEEQCNSYCDCKKIGTEVKEPNKFSCICNPLGVGTVQEIIDAVQKWIFTIALVIAPLMIILGAFYMMTSAGEPGRVQKGRSIIIWAAIGLGVVLLAKILYSVIIGVISG